MRALILFLMIFMLPVGTLQAKSYDDFLNQYDTLLKKHTGDSQKNNIAYIGVDYNGWKADKLYLQALENLEATSPSEFSAKNEKTAFWINAYNFLTIHLIIRENEQESIKNLGTIFQNPWKRYDWVIGGESYTLDQIEHDILRPLSGAPIHFAINCASLSCPDLRQEAYRASKLDKQLSEQITKALSQDDKILHQSEEAIYVSKIFDWFSEDFSGGDVKSWLQKYVSVDESLPVRYFQYDWSLNQQEK